MKKKKTIVLRVAAFWALFALLLYPVTRVFAHYPDYRSYQTIGGFYEEAADSLDAVYLGSSNCYAFWNALVAWHNHGLAVYPYASPDQPFYATEYLVREVRKTQPDARFIVSVNSVDADDLDASGAHYLLNYMPESGEKRALTDRLSDLMGYGWLDRLEFRFPWLRLRELWYDRLINGPVPELDGFNGAGTYKDYLGGAEDISDEYLDSDLRTAVPETLMEAPDRLLDYCDRAGVEVLFISVPRAEKTGETMGRINTVCDHLRARGYEVLDLSDQTVALGLDLTQDFYNDKHTNIHGSVKFTDGLCARLTALDPDLRDKRGDAAYADWDAAWERYADVIAPWLLDIELDAAHRDWTLPAPGSLEAAAADGGVRINWAAARGADGYSVYRKDGPDGAWTRLADTADTRFEDAEGAPDGDCRYTVVPWRASEGETFYGNFLYGGVKPE